jgi:acetylglutamate kinase
MTDVPGVLKDKNDVSTKYAALDIRGVRELVQEGIIAGGMIPKVRWGVTWGTWLGRAGACRP